MCLSLYMYILYIYSTYKKCMHPLNNGPPNGILYYSIILPFGNYNYPPQMKALNDCMIMSVNDNRNLKSCCIVTLASRNTLDWKPLTHTSTHTHTHTCTTTHTHTHTSTHTPHMEDHKSKFDILLRCVAHYICLSLRKHTPMQVLMTPLAFHMHTHTHLNTHLWSMEDQQVQGSSHPLSRRKSSEWQVWTWTYRQCENIWEYFSFIFYF